jgi:hypothetical protein
MLAGDVTSEKLRKKPFGQDVSTIIYLLSWFDVKVAHSWVQCQATIVFMSCCQTKLAGPLMCDTVAQWICDMWCLFYIWHRYLCILKMSSFQTISRVNANRLQGVDQVREVQGSGFLAFRLVGCDVWSLGFHVSSRSCVQALGFMTSEHREVIIWLSWVLISQCQQH